MPVRSYKLIRLGKRGYCIACKGLRFGDWLRKRVTLSQITSNIGRESTKHSSIYRCKQCNVYLCDNNRCFERFHKEK